MKTALVVPCYLDGTYQGKHSRLERNIRYIQYYRKLKDKLGFDRFYLIDNGSSRENLDALMKAVGDYDITFIRYDYHIPRGSIYDYPYLWRALWDFKKIIDDGYDKILSIDSDCFVLSDKLCSFIKDTNTGWQALYSKRYDFPETACFFLCKDTFPLYFEYTKGDWKDKNLLCMETELPFTNVLKCFNAERYGENGTPQTPEMDYYGQAPMDVKLVYGLQDSIIFNKG